MISRIYLQKNLEVMSLGTRVAYQTESVRFV